VLRSFENGKEVWGSVQFVLCVTDVFTWIGFNSLEVFLKATSFNHGMRSVNPDNEDVYSNFCSLVNNIISIV
jgi:hypothetical protein